MSTSARTFLTVLSLGGILAVASGCGGGGGYSAPPVLSGPASVTLTAVGRTLEVDWSKVSGADAYNVYIAASPSVAPLNYQTLPEGQHIPLAPKAPVSFGQLQEGQTYYVVVTPSARGTEGDASDVVSTTLQVGVPRRVFVTGEPASAHVQWDSLLGADSYAVYVASDERLTAGNWASLPEGSRHVVSSFKLDVPGLTDGRDYWFEVAGLNAQGEGPTSVRLHAVPTSRGTFPQSTTYDAGAGVTALVAVDFDRDGVEDVVVANPTTGEVSFLRGLGGGALDAPVLLTTLTTPSAILTADLDGDLNPDIVVTDSATGSVAVLLGDGAGGTRWIGETPVGVAPVGVAVGRLDSNALLDIVTANSGSDSVTVLVNQGDSGGLVLSPVTEIPVAAGPRAVAIGDLDGDGNEDVAVACATAGVVQVLHGDGEGGFFLVDALTPSIDPSDVAILDANGDGYRDVVVTSASGQVEILWGAGAGNFVASQAPITVGPVVNSLSVGQDVNDDGLMDLIVADEATGTFIVLLGEPGGLFTPYFTGAVGTDADQVQVADFNGDGIPDVAVTSHVDGTVAIFLGAPL